MRETRNDTHDRERRRRAGNAVAMTALLLVMAGGLLGWNYYRNYQIEMQDDKQKRPFAAFSEKDLAVMAEGYRQELAGASAGQRGGRVATRERFHFGDQVKEFERVQQETRRVRDRQIELAQVQAELQKIEAEQQLRAGGGPSAMVHLTRMFKI